MIAHLSEYLIKIVDPSGRLSNQDFEVQLRNNVKQMPLK